MKTETKKINRKKDKIEQKEENIIGKVRKYKKNR